MFSWSNKPPAPAPAASSSTSPPRPRPSSTMSRSFHLSSYLNHQVLKPSTRKVSTGKWKYNRSCKPFSFTPNRLRQWTNVSFLISISNYYLHIDDTIYDTVFQTTNGFALILRVYLPADVGRAPSMTLHGVRASHNWLDIRMKVIGYGPISSDQRWKASNLKLGDAVYAVIHHFQLTPREFTTYYFFVSFGLPATAKYLPLLMATNVFVLPFSLNTGYHRLQFAEITGEFIRSHQQAIAVGFNK